MTCSSDPESVFASLASLKALLPKCSIGKSVYGCVCMFACFQVILYLHNPFSISAHRVLHHRTDKNTSWKLIWGNNWCQQLMYSIFPLNRTQEEDTSCPASLSPLRLWSSICSCFPMCLSQRLLADLALTWPRKQKICSFLTESTKFNTRPFSPLCKPCCPRSFRPSDNNW